MGSGDKITNLYALSRRTVLTGLAGLAAARSAFAADTDSLVAHGILAQNPLAMAFESAPSELPDVMLTGPNGPRNISTLRGRTILMPLWAEWCAPCLEEIPDFARLQQKYGNAKFAIVPVLTGPKKKVDPDVIAKIFAFLHASVFEPLMEDNLSSHLMASMARRYNRYEIPCNLLIAPDGRVVGREFGLKSNSDDSASSGQPASPEPKGSIAQAEAGESLSLWGKPAGEKFAQAMAKGFLG